MNITGGKYNSRIVKAPESKTVRPTLSKIRSSIFNMLNGLIDFEKSSFLDGFSGSGIISLEALSRGFKKVVSIEKNPKNAVIIKDNFSQLGEIPNLIIKDTTKVLKNTEEKFDVIYLDPPYEDLRLYETTLNLIFENKILNPNGIIVVEAKKDLFNNEITNSFQIIKEKTYGDTVILFLGYKK